MFKLDVWEQMLSSGAYDAKTLKDAQSVADEMCAEIFARMGYTTDVSGDSLRVIGRGLTWLFPLRGTAISMRPGRPPSRKCKEEGGLNPTQPKRRGRPRKEESRE